MRSLRFEGCNKAIGGTQQQYHTLHAQQMPGLQGECRIIFELTDEEVAEIVRTKKLVYTQLTFSSPFQPMKISTKWPEDPVPAILPDTNADPKLN